MKPILALVLTVFTASALVGQTVEDPAVDTPDKAAAPELIRPADDTELGAFLWTKRPLVVFADSEQDPRFAEQIEKLEAEAGQMLARDVIVLTDTDPSARSPLRQKLRPRGFMLVLVAKDGAIILRKPFPWSVRELTRSIDKQPLRQREIKERRASGR